MSQNEPSIEDVFKIEDGKYYIFGYETFPYQYFKYLRIAQEHGVLSFLQNPDGTFVSDESDDSSNRLELSSGENTMEFSIMGYTISIRRNKRKCMS